MKDFNFDYTYYPERMRHMKTFRTVLKQPFYISTKDTPDRWFETMVFLAEEDASDEDGYTVNNWSEKYVKRYDTKTDAMGGHRILSAMSWREFLNEINVTAIEEDEE